MPINVVSNTSVSTAQILNELIPRVESIVERRTDTLEEFMAGTWPNTTNSGPQASGRDTQATDTSALAIDLESTVTPSVITIEFTIADDVNPRTGQPASDYAEYVHFTGATTGSALDRARDQFQRGITDIIEDIETAAAAILARR